MNKRALQARKGGEDAARELLTEAVKDLKSGNAAQREKAATMLCMVAAQSAVASDGQKKGGGGVPDGAALLVNAGAIGPLFGALKAGMDGLHMHAAAALATIAAARAEYRSAIGKAGAISHLCMLLRSGGAKTMLQAAAALSSLSELPEHHTRPSCRGARSPRWRDCSGWARWPTHRRPRRLRSPTCARRAPRRRMRVRRPERSRC